VLVASGIRIQLSHCQSIIEIHVKILGFIYTSLACLTFGLALIGFLISGNLLVNSIFAAFGFWWLQTGLGLINLQRGIKVPTFIVAVIFMIGLNGLLLHSGGESFRQTEWVIFHVACILIGIYTLVVLFLPATDEVWQKK